MVWRIFTAAIVGLMGLGLVGCVSPASKADNSQLVLETRLGRVVIILDEALSKEQGLRRRNLASSFG